MMMVKHLDFLLREDVHIKDLALKGATGPKIDGIKRRQKQLLILSSSQNLLQRFSPTLTSTYISLVHIKELPAYCALHVH